MASESRHSTLLRWCGTGRPPERSAPRRPRTIETAWPSPHETERRIGALSGCRCVASGRRREQITPRYRGWWGALTADHGAIEAGCPRRLCRPRGTSTWHSRRSGRSVGPRSPLLKLPGAEVTRAGRSHGCRSQGRCCAGGRVADVRSHLPGEQQAVYIVSPRFAPGSCYC